MLNFVYFLKLKKFLLLNMQINCLSSIMQAIDLYTMFLKTKIINIYIYVLDICIELELKIIKTSWLNKKVSIGLSE